MKAYLERAQKSVVERGRTVAGLAARAVDAASVVLVETSKVVAPSSPRPDLIEISAAAREAERREDAEILTTVALMKRLPRNLRSGDSLNLRALDEAGWNSVFYSATQIGLLRAGFTIEEVRQIMESKSGDVPEAYPDEPSAALREASEMHVVRAISEERPFHT